MTEINAAEKVQVFMAHEPGGYYAVCEGRTFGYMASQNEETRRLAWQGLVRIMARAVLEIRKQRRDLQEKVDRIERYRKIEEMTLVALQQRYDALNARVAAVERHRDQLLSQQRAIHKIMNSGEGK